MSRRQVTIVGTGQAGMETKPSYERCDQMTRHVATLATVVAAALLWMGCRALAETDKPKAGTDTRAASQPAAKFVNTRCPMMNAPIKPEKVTEALTREYNGQKVAFCCSMCTGAWDKLSDAEKDAKLKAVTAPKPEK